MSLVLAVVGVLTIAFSQVVERDGLPAGEYYALVLFAVVGMMMATPDRAWRSRITHA